MKRVYFKEILLAAVACVALLSGCNKKESSDFTFNSPIALADPFIMLHEGRYYAYGTADAAGIVVYQSADMNFWKKGPQLALDKQNSYGDRWFRSPEVYYIESLDKFFMYYTVDEHIAVASSNSPTGPFVQDIKQPLLGEKAIDPSLYIDEQGKVYLYFTKFNNGSEIWVTELYNDMVYVNQATMSRCLRVSQSWEVERGTVNEAPSVIKHNDTYYLTYSANSFESEYYGVGYATSASPTGPWEKFEENPIFQKPSNLEGTGHNAIFTDADGRLKCVFHAHHSHGNSDTRYMYISDVTFTDDEPAQMIISKDYQTPRLKY